MKLQRHLLKIFGPVLIIVALQSCADTPGYWKNDLIKAGQRTDFHDLNEKILKELKANDPKQLHAFMSKDLINHDGSTNTIVDMISNHLNDDSYVLLDEYYVINKYKDYDTLTTTSKEINSYNLFYSPGTEREMYFSFFLPKTGNNKYLLSIIYAKYDYGWKISQLDLSPYSINGKTAPELYELAKKNYDKNYLIDALNNLALATACLKPSLVWQYPKEQDIREFYASVINEANEKYKFPLMLSQVSTKPLVFRVFGQKFSGGTYPMIYYLSRINLKDTVAIKKENDQVKKVISKLMPGIDKDKKYILYAAFNERPGGGKTVDHFDMNEKLP